MLIKLDIKSDRVNGLSFHRKRPWILFSLHSGVIQLWDYRLRTMIRRFVEHEGPVRGVHIHNSRPWFVSGGDDYKIIVWNYNTHMCLFTLLGHLDRIRTVQFHHEKPWIVSASDDQTIRIWNWQSRTCISVLTGHNHNAMCASFHPKEDLVVSASSDHTVRVWDITSLGNKTASPADDAIVKYVLEGHDRGVNWASFHPTLPLIVSGSDDQQIKLWRMNETKAWEVVDTLRGHINNVSSVIFHAKQDMIISSSEDKRICVWDATKRTKFHTYQCERFRTWVLAVHPEINLLAAGHDSGMAVFKFERERPAFAFSGDSLFYAKDGFLSYYEYSSQKDSQVIPIQRPDSRRLNQNPRTLSYSPTENAVLICSDLDGGSYELYITPKDKVGRGGIVQGAKKGTCGSAVFLTRNKFAVLEKSTGQEVLVKNLKNEVIEKSSLPIPTDGIFYAGAGKLLCKSEDKLVIFDLQRRLVLGELQTPFVRYVVWSDDMESVALLSKDTIVFASKKLVFQCTLHETVGVKSGAWDDNGAFIYTTLNHIKYCLPNGESGIIRSLDVPIYITKVSGNTIFCLDRDGKNRVITINATEHLFKLSLLRKRYGHVMSMLNTSPLCGQATIAYLQQKGFPEVALHFSEDERIRFNLALESGNLRSAFASATQINEKDHWYRLGVEALRQGNSGIAEFAYQQTENFEKLSFLYLITGNIDKLSKLMKTAEVKNNVMSQFHNALYVGDVKERVKVLENAGHLPLAYITASVHGLNDIAERLATELGDNVPVLPEGKTPSLLMPPSPVMCGGDWPLLRAIKGIFESAARGGAVDGDWGKRLDMIDIDEMEIRDIDGILEEAEEENFEGGEWVLVAHQPERDTPKVSANARSSISVTPSQGMPVKGELRRRRRFQVVDIEP
ncbi:unnamed protein product [Brassica oleracea var. botrytis]|uniref:Uncharacterized protein n=2 Tax=Brassica TaxID=3705 RepID=A0A3P6EFP1_BRAOL|nr:coatomer subunit alpha-1-like [Brassica napus]CAF1788267.1 unnamed protein product [Brassica napus]VDD34184.1 unnamed protein product [Brassica oleracea]